MESPILKPSIDLLDAGLKEIIETQGRSSKSKIISGLFERITEAMSEGITLDMLVDYLRQNDILITKNTLRNTLYRIRKKRGHKPKTKHHQETITPQIEPVITNDNKQIYDQLIEQYNQCKNQTDKYIVLGGKREDIEHLPIGKQRDMVMKLRSSLRIKLKGTY